MKISKELIERYHHGRCTEEERAAVEEWLLSDDTEETVGWESPEQRTAVQAEMWEDIAGVLPASQDAPMSRKKPVILRAFWKPAVAAGLLAALGAALYTAKNQSGTQEVIALSNISGTENKDLHEKDFTLSIGPKSNVAINSKTGTLDFCGAVLINPKEDIELTFQGSCANPTQNRETVAMKKGQNYIALNYGGHARAAEAVAGEVPAGEVPAGEVIVVEEGAMVSLPPLVLKQLMHQFNI